MAGSCKPGTKHQVFLDHIRVYQFYKLDSVPQTWLATSGFTGSKIHTHTDWIRDGNLQEWNEGSAIFRVCLFPVTRRVSTLHVRTWHKFPEMNPPLKCVCKRKPWHFWQGAVEGKRRAIFLSWRWYHNVTWTTGAVIYVYSYSLVEFLSGRFPV